MMPIFRDHIYFDDALILHRTPTALLASDDRCSSLISAGTIARSA